MSASNTVPELDIIITEFSNMRLIEERLSWQVQLHYAFTDHLSSRRGETDAMGSVTSQEEYYPYGASAGSDE